jgi:hypothetical protein
MTLAFVLDPPHDSLTNSNRVGDRRYDHGEGFHFKFASLVGGCMRRSSTHVWALRELSENIIFALSSPTGLETSHRAGLHPNQSPSSKTRARPEANDLAFLEFRRSRIRLHCGCGSARPLLCGLTGRRKREIGFKTTKRLQDRACLPSNTAGRQTNAPTVRRLLEALDLCGETKRRQHCRNRFDYLVRH